VATTVSTSTRRRSVVLMRSLGVLAAVAAFLLVSACTSDRGARDGPTTTMPVAPVDPVDGEGVGGEDSGGAVVEEGAESPPALAPDGPPVGVNLLPPVAAGRPAEFGGGVSVTLIGTRSVDVEAMGPGETAGPAVAVTLEVRNRGRTPMDLGALAVNATGTDGTPAVPTSADPAAPFSGSVPPDGTARGVYVFRVERPGAPLIVDVGSSQSPDIVQLRTN
jgi:hypothetical protein